MRPAMSQIGGMALALQIGDICDGRLRTKQDSWQHRLQQQAHLRYCQCVSLFFIRKRSRTRK